MLVGGAPGWSVPIIAGLAGVSALVSVGAAWHARRAMPVGLCLAVLVVGTVWTALQAVSLPCGLAETLAPDAVLHARRTAELFGEEARCTITQDPARTREEVLKGLALVSLFVSASLTAAVAGRDMVIRIVAITCVIVGVSALGHGVLAATAIWGLYTPIDGSALLGPFVNPNHLGGLLAMGATVTLGHALSKRHRERRTQWLVGTWILLGCVAVTLSRGAILAAVGGLAFFAALVARERAAQTRTQNRSRLERLLTHPSSVAVLAVVLGTAVIGATAGLDAFRDDVMSADLTKVELALRGLELALAGPWTGVGRGAFGVAFVERAETGMVRFDHAENALAQWSVDWGIVMGPAIALGLLVVIARSVKRAHRTHILGAAVGLCVYAAQNMVDFGLEMLGSASVAVVLLAATVTDPAQAPVEDRSLLARSLPAAALGALITLAASALLGRSVHEQRVEIARAMLERAMADGDREEFAAVVRRAAVAHPREPVFPLLAGAEAARHGERASLGFLSRAMLLAPAWPSPHLVAARFLATHGHYDQALVEVREALERSPAVSLDVACRILQLRPGEETVRRLAPRNDRRRAALAGLAGCVPPDASGAGAVDEAILALEPTLEEPRGRLADRAVRRGDIAEARRWSESGSAESPVLLLVRARVELAAGDAEAALDSARDAERVATDPWDAVAVRARALARLGRWDEARDTIGELRGLSGARPERLAATDLLLGELERDGGHPGRALAAFEDAWRSFESLDALVQVARIATDLGDPERARAARRTLCERERTAYCDPPAPTAPSRP